MIASTRLAKAQRAMQTGKQYGIANSGMSMSFTRWRILCEHHFAEIFQNTQPEEAPTRKLFVVISSDKGLCGGIHSSVSKATRRSVKTGENGGSKDSPIVVVGDKSKAQLSRTLSSNLAITFNQIGRDIPTFADAAGVTDLIVKTGIKYDAIAIVYNKFVSALSYEHAVVEVPNEEVLKAAGG